MKNCKNCGRAVERLEVTGYYIWVHVDNQRVSCRDGDQAEPS